MHTAHAIRNFKVDRIPKQISRLHASPADLMNQVSFRVDNLRPRPVRSRRSGRPKLEWMRSCRDAFEIMNGPEVLFDASNIEHLRQVKDHVILRQPPFN